MLSAANLITVATFSTPLEAQLALAHLQEEGITGFILDDHIVGLLWAWSQTLGGIKLQVPADQAKLACAILEGSFSPPCDEALETAWQVGADELELAALKEDAEDTPLNRREENADRALRSAIFGLLFLPLQFYALYVLAKVFLANDPLRRRSWQRAMIAASINFPTICVALLILRYWLSMFATDSEMSWWFINTWHLYE